MNSSNSMRNYEVMRPINVVIFLVLLCGFGALGIYYGGLVAPFILLGKGAVVNLPTTSYALNLMLGAIGFAGFAISLYGFIVSLISIVKRNDDYTVKAFASYIALGCVACVAFFLNAAWVYRLTTTNNGYNEFGYIITLYVIALIVLLIATNVPLVKLFGEEKTANKTMKTIVGAAFAVNFGLCLPVALTYFSVLGKVFNQSSVITMKLGVYSLLTLVATLVSLAAFIAFEKADKQGKEGKAGFYLFGLSTLVDAGALITCGVFSTLYSKIKVNFMSANLEFAYSTEFAVMSYILGILLVLACVGVVIYSIVPHKKKAIETNF